MDYQEYHYFEPTENRENHFVHDEDEDILLNEIGEEILEVENWNIGIVDDEDRTKIVHEVVGILYKKLQQEVSVLSSRNLIEVLYDDLEKVLFKLMLSQKGMQKISLVILKRNKKYLNRQTEIINLLSH